MLRIPSSRWFINVETGPAPDNGSTSDACGNIAFHNAAVMRYLPASIRAHVGDTVEWADDTLNEDHGVTFLAGQPIPPIPDWYMSNPTGNITTYDGSTFFNSGQLYPADAGRGHSLTLTFTRADTFPYVDSEISSWGWRETSSWSRSVIVAALGNATGCAADTEGTRHVARLAAAPTLGPAERALWCLSRSQSGGLGK